MSKQEKRIARLCAIPIPKNFTWDDLVSVMRSAGFKEYCDGGSHYTFEHETGFTFGASKTHPSGILKLYQVRDAKEALRTVGAIREENNESE
ncbi:MAG TPA: type II toxin-antitoxin system HicA family toxin [Rhodocyclaceae bacterium]|nr:type II toxin-antitoxin system HicA family toxin [Rhodocyclaceae bacterium]